MTTPVTPEPTKETSILKWVGIGCGVTLLLLLGLGVGLFFLVKETLNISFDQQQADQTAQRIMDYKIPGGSRGFMSMNIGGVEFAGVMGAQNADAIVLILGKMPANIQSDPKQIQEAFEKNAEQQLGSSLKVTDRRTESKTLCGQTVNVNVLEGEKTSTGAGTGEPSLSYQTVVPHNNATIFVTLTTTGTAAKSTAAQIFKSLKCK